MGRRLSRAVDPAIRFGNHLGYFSGSARTKHVCRVVPCGMLTPRHDGCVWSRALVGSCCRPWRIACTTRWHGLCVVFGGVQVLDSPKYDAEAVMPSTTSVGLPWPHVRAYFASQLEKQKAYRANNLEGLPRAADVYTQLVSLENDPNKHKGAAPLMWSRPRQSGGF